MKNRLYALASMLVLSSSIVAGASTIGPGTYNLDNAFVDGYAVTGSVTFNGSSVATAVSLSFLDPAYSAQPTLFNSIAQSDTYSGLDQNYFTASGSQGGQVAIYFTNSSDSFGHFNLCIGNANCGTSGGPDASTLQTYGYSVSGFPYYVQGFGPDKFTSGYFALATPVTATPEPSSLALLGTGLLGVCGAMRRRLRRS